MSTSFSNDREFERAAIARGFVSGAKILTVRGARVTLGNDLAYGLSGKRSWVAWNDRGNPILYRDGTWATLLQAAQDDVIRVGDTVEAVEQSGARNLVLGAYYKVIALYLVERTVDVEAGGLVTSGVYTSRFKKVTTTSGSDFSPATNQPQYNEVSGSSFGKEHGLGKGQAICAGSNAGIVADAGPLAGNAVAASVGKGLVGGGEVGFTAIRSSHL